MKIIRVFPTHTSCTPIDDLAFSPEWQGVLPGLWRPDADEVHVSVTFTWDKPEAERLAEAWRQYYPVVRVGGPAYNMSPGGFVPGRYIITGVTFTSYGCNRRCPWCLVPEREGRLVEVGEFAEGWIIQDNNFLQCSREHMDNVFAMLWRQPYAAEFKGGLDARLLDTWVADQLVALRKAKKLGHIFLAADTPSSLNVLQKAIQLLRERAALAGTHFHRNKLKVYTLIGFNGETMDEAEKRLRAVWDIGGMPHAQLYQPPGDQKVDYGPAWEQFARQWSRNAIIKCRMGSPSPEPALASLF
jgi:hypothetical protein